MSLTPDFTIRNMTVKLSTSTASSDITNQIHGFTDLAHSKEDELMVITEGDGIYVTDERGTRYIDCTAGMYSCALGFNEPALAEAAYEQMRCLPTYHNLLATTTPPATALSKKLVEITPEQPTKVFLVNSGSEANDTIIKLIWYYNNAPLDPSWRREHAGRGEAARRISAARFAGARPGGRIRAGSG